MTYVDDKAVSNFDNSNNRNDLTKFYLAKIPTVRVIFVFVDSNKWNNLTYRYFEHTLGNNTVTC